MNEKIALPHLLSHRVFYRKKFFVERQAFDAWYVLLVEAGSFEINMMGRRSVVGENEMCVFPPGCYFERNVIEPIFHHEIILKFDESEKTLKELGQYYTGKISVFDKTRLASTMQHLRALNEARIDNMEIYQHYIEDIWYQIAMERVVESQFTHRHLMLNGEAKDKLVKQSLVIFDEKMDQKIVIGDVARELGVSPATLCRRFISDLGTTPSDYLIRMRIQKARQLLVGTQSPLNVISDVCGFDNQFYFCNCFKKHFGVSPSAYRRSSGVNGEI